MEFPWESMSMLAWGHIVDTTYALVNKLVPSPEIQKLTSWIYGLTRIASQSDFTVIVQNPLMA